MDVAIQNFYLDSRARRQPLCARSCLRRVTPSRAFFLPPNHKVTVRAVQPSNCLIVSCVPSKHSVWAFLLRQFVRCKVCG